MFGPPKSGKTTSLLRASDDLNAKGGYVCIYWTLTSIILPAEGEKSRDASSIFNLRLLDSLVNAVHEFQKGGYLSNSFRCSEVSQELRTGPFTQGALCKFLKRLAHFVQDENGQKLVILVDDVDKLASPGLEPKWLIHFLNMLRALHATSHAPWTLGLSGPYDVVRVHDRYNNANHWMTPRRWEEDHLREILQQYVKDPGRTIKGDEVKKLIFESGGNPWLCNYIMYNVAQRPDANPVSVEHVEHEVEKMFQDRVTGISSLEDCIRNDKLLRRGIFEMSAGLNSDMECAEDLGVACEQGQLKYRFLSNIVRVVCHRYLAQESIDALKSSIADIRSNYVHSDHLDWCVLMGQLYACHMGRQIPVALRSIAPDVQWVSDHPWDPIGKQILLDIINENKDIFSIFKRAVSVCLFNDTATGGLLFLLNDDSRGSVHTPAEDGPKPDHILRRLLDDGTSSYALVKNKLAKPNTDGVAVSDQEINDKMEEAIIDLSA